MKTSSLSIQKQSLIFSFISVLWLIYLVIRAYYVPITFDESATFFHFVHRGDMWFFDSLPDANNHLINSFLTYISYHLFGASKLALRLPNLLSAILFLYFLFRTSLFIKNISLRWIFILSLMFSHYFIEFFAVSRGYGLSMAFLFGVLYHLMRFSVNRSTRHILYISLFLVLAEFSNLSILVLSITIVGYQIIMLLFADISKVKSKLYRLATIIILEILPLLFAGYYMYYLQDKGSLYYGDSSGFWSLTIMSLILLITGTKLIVFSVSVVILTVFVIIATVTILIKSKFQKLFQPSLVFSLLLFSTIIGLLILANLFGINNPEDRVAMYLIPLFFGAIIMVTDKLVEETDKKLFILIVLPLLYFPIHFFYVINLQYVNGYKTEVVPERFYEIVMNDEDNQGEYPATIGGYRMRMFCWTYMNFINGGSQNLINYQDYPELRSDYQIVDINEHPEWLEHYDLIDTEDVLGRALLKRKKRLEPRVISSKIIDSTINISNDEYYNLAIWDTDTIAEKSLLINISIDIHSTEIPFHAWVVLQVADTNGKNIIYKYIPFDWLRTKWEKGDERFNHSFLTGNLPSNPGLIYVYIWNIDKVVYTIESAKITLYMIE